MVLRKLTFFTVLLLLFITPSFSFIFGGGTCNRRSASVRVTNNAGQSILYGELIHKYSNDYVDAGKFSGVANGQQSSNILNARYHTGFMCNGADWWWLSWSDSAGRVCASDPKNFRCIIDIHETIGTVGARIAMASGDPLTKAVSFVASQVLNTGSTCGFKRHILEKQDAGTVVDIVIRHYENNGVEIHSRSGISTTDYSCKHAGK